jgi:hypothetical protein
MAQPGAPVRERMKGDLVAVGIVAIRDVLSFLWAVPIVRRVAVLRLGGLVERADCLAVGGGVIVIGWRGPVEDCGIASG